MLSYFKNSFFVAAVHLIFCFTSAWAEKEPSPDVVMIVVDDMNDSISLLSPEHGIKTPNIEKLAKRGTSFTKAYCQSPACNPSRAAVMTGLNPSSTGVYGNKSDWKKAIKNHPTFFELFRSSGYQVEGAGKIYHHHLNGAFHHDESFDAFQHMDKQNMPKVKLNKAPEYGSRNTDWGAWPLDERETIYFQSVDFCIQRLKSRNPAKPIFLTCGIFKPHSPFFAPPQYQATHGENFKITEYAHDLEDLPSGANRILNLKKWFYQGMMKLDRKRPGSFQNFINSYAACCRFADAQIGRLMAAVDEHTKKENTIIILWSDHGFHLGEKQHIEKFALWERTTRVPFIIVAPDIANPGSECETPVDLSSIYPTLCDLAKIKNAPRNLDGHSLVPLLNNDFEDWPYPALSTYGVGNHAVRKDNWRFIHYSDGSKELYNLKSDPNEWHNLADKPQYKKIISRLTSYLPKKEKEQVKDLKLKK